MHKKIVIIGAGPCGLGAAWALNEMGHEDWVVLERGQQAGGLSASFVDKKGFTWDIGGHVLFSHYPEFDAMLDSVMHGDMIEHTRKSFIRSADCWVGYPFQNNLSDLPPEVQLECLIGLKNAAGAAGVENFNDWINGVFGTGIARHFLGPYNRKVWSVPLEEMDFKWIAERVSVVDFDSALKNVILKEDDDKWGPNATFSFPKVGGTGEIFRRMAEPLSDKIRFTASVSSISLENKTVYLNDGETVSYDSLISTMPLDKLVSIISEAPDEISKAADSLVHNSVLVVGLGFKVPLVDHERCWFYFPGDGSPFYRVTNFAKYSPMNVPGGDIAKYSSYLCETSYSGTKPVDRKSIIDATRRGLVTEGIIDEEILSKEVSSYLIDVEYGYPIPSLGRDRALGTLQPFLMERGIYSRGRFGAWLYESGNMDHSVKMGMDAADLIISGRKEELWRL